MDIWVSWAKRKATCHYCSKPILARTPIIKGKMWKKMATATKWSIMFYWHPECWLNQAYAYLEQHPFIPKRGRAKLVLDKDAKTKRLKLLRERARLIYRLKDIMLYGNNSDIEERILSRLLELVVEIEPLGGVPKSWDKLPIKEELTKAELKERSFGKGVTKEKLTKEKFEERSSWERV